jgi:hypothetical protein
LDDEYLNQLVFIEDKGNRLEESRETLSTLLQTKYLDTRTNPILINENTFEKYYYLFIMEDLMEAETTFSKTKGPKEFQQTVERMSLKMREV